jgi:hypothetical protein
MLDLTQIDTLLAIGILVAFIAISGGVRGVYSVSASARRERSNQATTTLPVSAESRQRGQAGKPADKRRQAA